MEQAALTHGTNDERQRTNVEFRPLSFVIRLPAMHRRAAARGCSRLGLLALLLLPLLGCDAASGGSAERIRLLITPVPTPTMTPLAQPTAAPVKYTVSAGDTLSGIAAQFGVTVDDIVRVNNIADPNALSEGQVLTIPGRTPPTPIGGLMPTAVVPVTGTLTVAPGADGTRTAGPAGTPTLPPLDATPPQGPDVPEVPEQATAGTTTQEVSPTQGPQPSPGITETPTSSP